MNTSRAAAEAADGLKDVAAQKRAGRASDGRKWSALVTSIAERSTFDRVAVVRVRGQLTALTKTPPAAGVAGS